MLLFREIQSNFQKKFSESWFFQSLKFKISIKLKIELLSIEVKVATNLYIISHSFLNLYKHFWTFKIF